MRWLLLMLLLSIPLAAAVNDPGHDSLYVLLTGDSNIIGSLNITSNVTANNIRAASLIYGDQLDIRANGTIFGGAQSRPTFQASSSELYIDASTLNVKTITSGGIVQIGSRTLNDVILNVSGVIRQQGVLVCLANGTNCPGGNNTGNVSSIIAGNGVSVDQPTGPVTISTSATTCGATEYSYWDGNSWECRADLNSGGTGDVTGPASSTDNAVARFDSTTGKIIQSSTVTIDDAGNMAGVGNITTGTTFFIGTSTVLSGDDAIAIGNMANATGDAAQAFGYDTRAEDYSVAAGYSAAARTTYAVAIGINADVSQTQSIAIGDSSVAAGAYSVTVGKGAQTYDDGSIAIGPNAIAGADSTGVKMIAIGYDAYAAYQNSIAIGEGATAGYANSIALGRSASSTAANQFIVGSTSYPLNTRIVGNLSATGTLLNISGSGAAGYIAGSQICTAANGACPAGTGDVVGAPSSTDTAIARFDSTSGKNIQNSVVTIDDAGNMAGVGNISTANAFSIGASANASGDSSIALGRSAAATATRAIAIGYQAEAKNTSTTSIGYRAGYNSSSTYRTAAGYEAGYSSSGSGLTAIGYAAGVQSNGIYVTTVGYAAGYQNTVNYLTATGFQAGQENSGIGTTATGYSAAYQNTGTYLAAIGYQAGYQNNGTNAILMGYQAGYQNNGSNVVAIGYQAGYQNTEPNQFIVRQASINAIPLIQGNFSSGNVGIGMATPRAKLHVNGSINVTAGSDICITGGNCLSTATGTGGGNGWTNTSTTVYATDTNDNVSIGATSATRKLHVQGDTNISGVAYTGAIQTSIVNTGDSGVHVNNAANEKVLSLYYTDENYIESINLPLNFITATAYSFTYGTGFILSNDSTTQFFVNGSTGNTGIGTATPRQKLDVNGSINVTGNITMKTNNSICFNENCSARIYFNGTALVIQG